MDPLRDVLDTVMLETSVFCRAELESPWALRTQPLPFGIFHAIATGSCWIDVDGETSPLPLHAGDVAVLPHGAGHVMTYRPGAPARDMRSLDATRGPGGVDTIEILGGGEGTSLFCGRFALRRSDVHPLFAELPPIIVLRNDPALVGWVAASVELIARELDTPRPGGDTMVARLADVLVLEAIRTYVAQLDSGRGWLHGLADQEVSRAMGLIHSTPERQWSVAELAREVGVSRATLFRRFSDRVGMTPSAYRTTWRMHLAARLLREDQMTVAAAAHRVGYSSEASFSHAFLLATGVRPGAYRKAG